VGDVARRLALRLERDIDRDVARHLVFRRVVAMPGAERGAAPFSHVAVRERAVAGRIEEGLEARDLRLRDLGTRVPAALPLGLHAAADLLYSQSPPQDLDARLVDVVPAALEVVDPQDGLEVGQQVLARQEFAHHLAEDGRTAEAAAREYLETQIACG